MTTSTLKERVEDFRTTTGSMVNWSPTIILGKHNELLTAIFDEIERRGMFYGRQTRALNEVRAELGLEKKV